MSDDVDTLHLVSFFIVMGIPMLFGYLAVDFRWAVEVGTFACAWWACWILWTDTA